MTTDKHESSGFSKGKGTLSREVERECFSA